MISCVLKRSRKPLFLSMPFTTTMATATRTRRAAASTKATDETNSGATTNPTAVQDLVDKMLMDASLTTTTTTKAGWCLRQGLIHIMTADGGRLQSLVQSQGPPSFYHSLTTCRHEPTDNIKAPVDCFQSLCRIIAGQQLAGKAAQSIWKRLLETTQHNLTPASILALASQNMEQSLQKPAGLSRAKAKSIVDLAQQFESPTSNNNKNDSSLLSEEFLSNPQSTQEQIREELLKVKGLGPWSCDMFIMFHLEKPNVFPFGDLGVRKGVAKVFQIKGKGAKGSLCPKKDLDRAQALVDAYQPFQSLFTYYMWRAADTKDVYGGPEEEERKNDRKRKVETASPVSTTTPAKRATRNRKVPAVTP